MGVTSVSVGVAGGALFATTSAPLTLTVFCLPAAMRGQDYYGRRRTLGTICRWTVISCLIFTSIPGREVMGWAKGLTPVKDLLSKMSDLAANLGKALKINTIAANPLVEKISWACGKVFLIPQTFERYVAQPFVQLFGPLTVGFVVWAYGTEFSD